MGVALKIKVLTKKKSRCDVSWVAACAAMTNVWVRDERVGKGPRVQTPYYTRSYRPSLHQANAIKASNAARASRPVNMGVTLMPRVT
jgi:hypothetical protein